MLKLTKTGIGLLTKQYRSVLRKCLLLNLGLCISIASSAMASVTGGAYYSLEDAQMANDLNIGKFNIMSSNGLAYFMEISADVEKGSYVSLRNSLGRVTAELISSVNNGGILRLRNSMGTLKTELSDSSFQLNGSTILATGIVAEAIQNSTALITSGGVYDALNYYYTKTEADARYALLDTIGDVDYSDEAADEGSALKNGEEDSPTTVRGALDLLDTKIGSLNETGIAGDDVATQLKYILENGSTGGAGVALSTLGYIGANTPYLNTTSNAMNFSSTYTIGGNMSTLANQIKTNENSISALNTRVNNLGTYGGTLELTDNYGKIMGDVSTVRNGEQLGAATINVKPYATLQDVNLKSYTVELSTTIAGGAETSTRHYRIQVYAPSQEEAVAKAKNKITNSWSSQRLNVSVAGVDYYTYINEYIYAVDTLSQPIGYSDKGAANAAIQATDDVTVTENNYTVSYHTDLYNQDYEVNVNASNPTKAIEKADQIIDESWYVGGNDSNKNLYYHISVSDANMPVYKPGILSTSEHTTANGATITDGSLGTAETYVLGNGTVIENIALLDNAIGDLETTGVSGASVAAQLKLLGEVGSEALGQKIGSWTATKDSILQTLGEETKNYGYLTAFEYDSENEQYVGTVGDNLTALDTALSLTAKGLDALSHQLYNYYYTFRVDERVEAIEFAKELRSNKKEMSSLDFMPIKSSSDLRINLIKAEDPLTFSAKTRDDSLVLMEVCHA